MAQRTTVPMMRMGANVSAPRTRRVDMTPRRVMVTRSPRHEAIGGAMLSEGREYVNAYRRWELGTHQGHDPTFGKGRQGNT